MRCKEYSGIGSCAGHVALPCLAGRSRRLGCSAARLNLHKSAAQLTPLDRPTPGFIVQHAIVWRPGIIVSRLRTEALGIQLEVSQELALREIARYHL